MRETCRTYLSFIGSIELCEEFYDNCIDDILLGGNDYMSLAFISSQQSLGSLLYILIETLLGPMLIDAWVIIHIVGPPPEIRRLLFNRRGELWVKMPVLALGDQSLDQPPK